MPPVYHAKAVMERISIVSRRSWRMLWRSRGMTNKATRIQPAIRAVNPIRICAVSGETTSHQRSGSKEKRMIRRITETFRSALSGRRIVFSSATIRATASFLRLARWVRNSGNTSSLGGALLYVSYLKTMAPRRDRERSGDQLSGSGRESGGNLFETEECGDHVGVEVGTGLLTDVGQGLLFRPRGAVRTIGR